MRFAPRSTWIALVTMLLVPACGEDSGVTEAGATGTNPGAVQLPSLDYQLLLGEFDDTAFDASARPCLYVTVDSARLLVLFPPGSTFEAASHTLTVGGAIGGSGSTDGPLDVVGGELPVSTIEVQHLEFDARGCEHTERVLYVTGVEPSG